LNDLHLTIHLPVVIYSESKGLDIFSSSKFFDSHHKKIYYNSYSLNSHDKVVSSNIENIFYDFSITKNVAVLFLSVLILFFFFISIANKYKKKKYYIPRGFDVILEQMICFIRDEVAIPNIGKKRYTSFMPYLLTIFFFIYLNNLMGLLPG